MQHAVQPREGNPDNVTWWSIKSVVGDARYAARSFLRAPVFSSAAVFALALCLGANAVIFAVVYGTVLRPSDYPDASELVWVWSSGELALTHHKFLTLQPDVSDQIVLTAFVGQSFALTGGQTPLEVTGIAVSANHFDVIGLPPAYGRGFRPEDARPGADPVAVISQELWRTQFGGDPDVLHRTVDLLTAAAIPMVSGAFTGSRHTVIGIAPPAYRPFGYHTDVITPLIQDPAHPSFTNMSQLSMAGRLRAGVTIAQARSSIVNATSNLVEFEREREAIAVEAIVPLRDALDGNLRPAMYAILAGVGLVLLIGCANVANLFLVRAHDRDRELSVRYALGATRSRIVSQFVIESLVLSTVAAVLGTGLAAWSLPVVVNLLPAGVPVDGVRLDGATLLFGIGLLFITTIACGVLPGMRHRPAARTPGVHSRLGSGRSRRIHSINRALLVSQIAIAVILVNGAALLFTDFARLLAEDKGFSPERVTTVRVAPAAGEYRDPEVRRSLYNEVLARVRDLPDVASAGAIHFLPIADGGPSVRFQADPGDSESVQSVGYRVITPSYLESMEIPLRQGRFIDETDVAGSTRVGLVNTALAHRLWPDDEPIGQTLYRTSGDVWFTVVGVVGDVRQAALGLPPRPEVYLPLDQSEWASAMTIVARTHGPPGSVGERIRTIVTEIDPDLPVTRVAAMNAIIDASVSGPRFFSALFATFAAIAILLGAVGVYGVVAFVVQTKRDEIGVRIALGATRATILGRELRQGAIMTATGVGIGLLGAAFSANGMSALLYDVDPFDPILFGLTALGVAAVAAVSILVPVARISRIDPMTAIRSE